MRGRFFSRIIVLVSISAILVIALGIYASRSLATLNQGNDWVVHSQRLRYELSHVLQLLVDAGSGARRFEATHEDRSFQEADIALADLPLELATLHRILLDDPELSVYESQLLEVAHRREAMSKELIDMARAGNFDAVHRITQSSDSLRLLDRCRAVIAHMQDEESRIFEAHRSASETARQTVAFAIIATTALAVMLLMLTASFSLRHDARLRQVQEDLATTMHTLTTSEAALREADQRKDVFLATLSHELRNPLAPIRNAARLLESPGLSHAELERSRLIIARQVRHMASLLDDLLDVSRITRGMLTLKKEIIDLRQPFEAAVESARPAIEAKRHTLAVDWPSEGIRIRADPVRLTQILTNLLTNAAKYTDPDGKINMGCRVEGREISIQVRDNGIGLAPDTLSKVFDMFSQVAPNKARNDSGLGIGLALVKGLVELHGGRVEAISAGLERGSEFVVHFPDSLYEAAPSPPPARERCAQTERPPGLRVLIADDNRDSAESLGMLLELSGHEVLLAHDGLQALAMAAESRPDAALLDIGMPGMDGFQVAAGIRREPWGADITLIAITGWGQEEAKRMARTAGFDHHLTKPMDTAVLESLLAGVVQRV